MKTLRKKIEKINFAALIQYMTTGKLHVVTTEKSKKYYEDMKHVATWEDGVGMVTQNIFELIESRRKV